MKAQPKDFPGMCFSATASFTAGACLLMGGLYGMNRAIQYAPQWVPLTIYPVAFAIQQLMEGGVWVSLKDSSLDGAHTTQFFALGFLFFSHCFWLFWVPFSIFWLEERQLQRRVLFVLIILGSLLGVYLYLPVLFNDWVQVNVASGHIAYDIRLAFGGLLPWTTGRLLYAGLTLIPFLVTPKVSLNLLGILLFLAMVVTVWLYEAIAFISVWCFFAAIISAYILYVLHEEIVLETQ